MNKQTVALIALCAGWILTADIADATAYEDIAGQWCGDEVRCRPIFILVKGLLFALRPSKQPQADGDRGIG
jgi:hypothetical protein